MSLVTSFGRLVFALYMREYHRWRYTWLKSEVWLVVHKVPHGIRHTLLRPAFWIGLTLGFPLEHVLWEKVWPFAEVTKWLGL